MMFALALSVVGCKKNKDKDKESSKEPTSQVQSTPESTPGSTPESTPESLPGVIPPVDANPAQPVDGVDVSPILDILNPILGNEYVTIEFTMSMDTVNPGSTSQDTTHVVAHVKNTDDGYDLVATIETSSTFEYTSGGETDTHAYNLVYTLYYVDGMVLIGEKYQDNEPEYLAGEVGTVNELLTMVNGMIAEDPDMKAAYTQIMPAVEELLAVIDEADLNRTTVNETINVKAMYDAFADYIAANENVDMYTWILRDVLGIDPTDDAAVAAFESEILAIGANDPTMAQVLDRVVAYVNSKLPQDTQINLKAIVDELQATVGITTAEAVDMFNHEMFCEMVWDEDLQDVVEVCHEELFLPAPEAGVTIYDYAYTLLNTVKLNDLLAEEDFTDFADAFGFVKSALQHFTFGEWFNDIMGAVAGESHEYEYVGEGNGDYAWLEDGYYSYVGENNGNYAWNSSIGAYENVGWGNGDYEWYSYGWDYKYVGEGNGDYIWVEIDYLAMIKDAKPMINKADVTLTYTPDALGRPVTAGAVVDMAITVEGQVGTQVTNVAISFTYTQPSVSFEIPADALANAGDLFEAMGGGSVEVSPESI